MSSVINNFINKMCAVAAVGTLIASAFGTISCDSQARREKASCDSLVNVAKDLVAQNRFVEAFAVMDSVDARFPQQVEARSELMLIRSQAMTDYSQQQIIVTDSIMAVLQTQIDALGPQMKHVEGDDIAGYYVVGAIGRPNFVSTTGIEGRVDDEALYFYLVASNSGKPIGINRLEFVSPAGRVLSAAIDPNSERSGDTDHYGIDLATFLAADLADVIPALERSPESYTQVVLHGKDGGKVNVSLTPAQAKALVDTWHFADVCSRMQQAKLLHDKYQQQLIISRDHTVNLQ